MGSFNSSGFISKLPIRRGDRVVCFIATENPYASIRSLYIPDCHLVPWGIPVRGKYNDYGSIENIDEDYNTDFLRRLFKVDDVTKIFDAIERCMYGETLDENIKYWKHNKEEVKQYKMLLPMYGNIKEYMKFMNSSIGSKRKTQPLCTLLFEHEEVYDHITENEIDDGWHNTNFTDAIDAHFNIIKIESELDNLINEYYGENEKDSTIPQKTLKTFFERRHNDFDDFRIEVSIIERDFKDLPEQPELVKQIKSKYEEYKKYSQSNQVHWETEGRSPMFMMQFKFMKPETYLRFFEEKKTEIVRFCRLMRYMSYGPLLFECSITAGQQQYNYNGFIDLYDYLHKFSERLFEEDVAQEEYERRLDAGEIADDAE